MLGGGVATALFLATDVWVGPFAAAIGDMSLDIPAPIDLSAPLGMIVSIVLYVLLAGKRVRAQVEA